MIATLSLVYVHGTDSNQQSAPANITIARGESSRWRAYVVDSAGVVVDLTDRSIVYAVAPYAGASTVIYRTLTPVSDPLGTADLILASSDTIALDRSSYTARFWMLDGSGAQTPLSAVSVLRLSDSVATLAATPTTPPEGDDITTVLSDAATFTAAASVAVVFAAPFETAEYDLHVFAPIVTDDSGGISVQVSNVTAAGFTLTASAEFTGTVPYTAIGVLA